MPEVCLASAYCSLGCSLALSVDGRRSTSLDRIDFIAHDIRVASVVRPPLRLLSVVHVHVHVYADGNSDSNIEAVEGARGDGREHEDYFSPVSAAFIPLPRLASPRLARQSVSRHNEARQPPLFRIPVCRPPARPLARRGVAWRGSRHPWHGHGRASRSERNFANG